MTGGRPDARNIARAIDALRRGWPIAIDDIGFLAVETADDAALAAFDRDAMTSEGLAS